LRQVVFLLLHVQSEGEVLRIHPADVQIGDVAHRAYGERRIEARPLRFACRGEPGHSSFPAWAVVVLRVQALLVGLLQNANHAQCLRNRPAVPNPRRFVLAGFIETLHMLPVVGKTRPAEVVQARGFGDLPQSGRGFAGGVLRSRGGEQAE